MKNQDQLNYDEEQNPEVFARERITSLNRIKLLSYVTIFLAFVQIIFNIVHWVIHSLGLAIVLLFTGLVFLIGAAFIVYWANQATKIYKANRDLMQPRANDRATKSVFILGLLFAMHSVFLFVNLLVQRQYTPDYVNAQNTDQNTWDDYSDNKPKTLSDYVKVIFWIQLVFMVYYFIYSLLASKTAFGALKWDNQAMSYLAFLGNVLLLTFGLLIIYYASYASGYQNYPAIKAHFPTWNVRGLYFAGICVAVVALVGFLVDHRSWRAGFFVLSFLLLVLIVLLGNFTGFAYYHTNQTYLYYKGVPSVGTCTNRMNYVAWSELQDVGCPRKYLANDQCDSAQRVFQWEETQEPEEEDEDQTTDNAAPAPAQEQGKQPPAMAFDEMSMNAAEGLAWGTLKYYCLNTKCCGLMGQLYTRPLLRLANSGALALLAAVLVSIACYYFWFVKWVDTARDKKKDYIWLGLMLLIFVAFVIFMVNANKTYVKERLDANGAHYCAKDLVGDDACSFRIGS